MSRKFVSRKFVMGSFWLWGWWFFLTLPDRLSCPPFIYMVHFEVEFTYLKLILNELKVQAFVLLFCIFIGHA
jgi:hypothetical protein